MQYSIKAITGTTSRKIKKSLSIKSFGPTKTNVAKIDIKQEVININFITLKVSLSLVGLFKRVSMDLMMPHIDAIETKIELIVVKYIKDTAPCDTKSKDKETTQRINNMLFNINDIQLNTLFFIFTPPKFIFIIMNFSL